MLLVTDLHLCEAEFDRALQWARSFDSASDIVELRGRLRHRILGRVRK
jgi:hypothetical protein